MNNIPRPISDISSEDPGNGNIRLERLNALLKLAAALSGALTPADVARIIVGRGIAALGAVAGSVTLVNSTLDGLDIVASVGYPGELIGSWTSFPLTARVPLAECVRTATAIWLDGPEEVARLYPAIASRQLQGYGVVAALPLIADGAPIGAIGLNFPDGTVSDAEDQAFMLALAHQCTMALERSRLYDAELRERKRAEEAERRLGFLTRAGEVLAYSLDPETTQQSIVGIVVPELADGCTIHLSETDGTLRWTSIAHVDPRKEKIMEELSERYPINPNAEGGITSVMRSGTGILVRQSDPASIRQYAVDEENARMLLQLETISMMIIPLAARGDVIGAMVIVRQAGSPAYTDEDFALAVELSRRAALAIDSARRFTTLHREIARRRRVEQALGESEIRFRTIFEQSPLAIQTFAPDGGIRSANRAWEVLWETGREALAGYNILNDPQLEAKGLIPEVRRAFAGDRVVLPAMSYDPADIGRTGRLRWVRALFYPIEDEGNITEMVLILEDVTDRIEQQEKLSLSEERFRTLVETAPDVIYSLSASSGTITALNPAFEVLTGRRREDWIGRSFHPLIHPDDIGIAIEKFARVVTGETPEPYELRVVTIDGSYRTGEFRSRPRYQDGRVVESLGIARDVTGRKESERELIIARNVAEAASRAKDQFLATLSHELRTPLTPVLAAVQALEEGCDPEDLAPLVEIIHRNIRLEAHLIDDMLDLTRIARGKIQLDMGPLDPHRLIAHVIEICSGEIESKHLLMVLDLDPRDSVVNADPSRLQQIFWNLIQNAVKFTPPEGHLTLRSTIAGTRWRLEVIDSGIGIPADVLPYIFNAFEQGDVTITRQFGGLGLGLAITRALVEAHNGSLTAQSEGAGTGATFVVELDLA